MFMTQQGWSKWCSTAYANVCLLKTHPVSSGGVFLILLSCSNSLEKVLPIQFTGSNQEI